MGLNLQQHNMKLSIKEMYTRVKHSVRDFIGQDWVGLVCRDVPAPFVVIPPELGAYWGESTWEEKHGTGLNLQEHYIKLSIKEMYMRVKFG